MPNYKRPLLFCGQILKWLHVSFAHIFTNCAWNHLEHDLLSLLCPYTLHLTTASYNIWHYDGFLLWSEQGPPGGCAFTPCACIWHYTVYMHQVAHASYENLGHVQSYRQVRGEHPVALSPASCQQSISQTSHRIIAGNHGTQASSGGAKTLAKCGVISSRTWGKPGLDNAVLVWGKQIVASQQKVT